MTQYLVAIKVRVYMQSYHMQVVCILYDGSWWFYELYESSSRGLGAVEMAKFANRFYPEHSSKAWSALFVTIS